MKGPGLGEGEGEGEGPVTLLRPHPIAIAARTAIAILAQTSCRNRLFVIDGAVDRRRTAVCSRASVAECTTRTSCISPAVCGSREPKPIVINVFAGSHLPMDWAALVGLIDYCNKISPP